MICWILIAGQPKKKLSQWLWRRRRRPSWRVALASPGCPGPSWPASTWRRSWKGRPRKCFVFLCFHLRAALYLFLYVFISGRLNRERNSDESERQWKLARRKRRCGICQENILLLFYGEHFSDMCFMRHRMSCEWQQFSWNLTLKRITRLGEGNWKRGNCRCLRGMRRLSPSSRTSGVTGPRRFLGDFDF